VAFLLLLGSLLLPTSLLLLLCQKLVTDCSVRRQTQGAHLQRPPPRLAEVEKMKNARLHSRRQLQTPGARLQRLPPRLVVMKNPS
jgi:hypothetical protein